MFTSGGGGMGGLPQIDDPVQAVIALLVLGLVVWLGFRFFSS
jgi:hypothetical protein